MKIKSFFSFIFNHKKSIGLGIGFAAYTFLIGWFFANYTVRTPIVITFQNPVVYRGSQKQEKPATSHSTSKFNPSKVTPTPTKKTNAEEAIYVYFGEDKVARAVAKAESGLNCKSISSTSDYGLFQIHLPLHQWRFDRFGGDPLDCWDSARVAHEINQESGWYPWVGYTSLAYLKFL